MSIEEVRGLRLKVQCLYIDTILSSMGVLAPRSGARS